MDPAIPYKILAVCCAVGVYALCIRNFVRSANFESKNSVSLKTVFLGAGHFAALVIGFVALIDTAGAASACAYAVIATVSAFVLNAYLPSKWMAQEKAQSAQIEKLAATVEALHNRVSADQPDSLDEACAKAARAFGLTRREEEVLGLLVQGFTYAEIEEQLYLSHSTVKSHVRNLYRKMEVNRRESLSQKIGR